MKKKSVAVLGAGLLAAGFALFNLNNSMLPDDAGIALKKVESETTQPEASAAAGSAGQVSVHNEGAFALLKSQIMARMDGRLAHPFWQVKMLRDLKLFFQKQYPDNWEEEFLAFIRYAFPDQADAFIAKFHATEEYEQWVSNLKPTSQFSSEEERRQAMWDKRLALFGDEAYQIWAAELQVEQFNQRLQQLAEFSGSFEEKQQQYIESVKSVFGANALAPEAGNKDQKMIQFLELQNVQQDLRSMSQEQQTAALRNLRAQIGLDEAALARWDDLDAQRAQQRSRGEAYKVQRQQLASRYSGAELETKVDSLRLEMFGETQASFIRNEERSGYYRFDEPQQIGIN